MTIAMTGGRGLLGTLLIEKLQQEKVSIKALSRKPMQAKEGVQWIQGNLSDIGALEELCEDADIVIHVGALVSFDPRKHDRIMESNVEGTQNVVNTCLSLGIPKLVYISSVAALGTHTNEIHGVQSRENLTLYGWSKYLGELEVLRGQEEGLQTAIVNPSVILAPAPNFRSSAQLLKMALSKPLFYIDATLNYVDGRDVIEIIYRLTQQELHGEKWIANNTAITHKELFHKMATCLGNKPPKYKIPTFVLYLIAYLEAIITFFTRRSPTMSTELIQAMKNKTCFDNTKSKKQLDIKYHTLDETLNWCFSAKKG